MCTYTCVYAGFVNVFNFLFMNPGSSMQIHFLRFVIYIYIVEYMFELGFILLNTLLLQAAAGSSPARASQMP